MTHSIWYSQHFVIDGVKQLSDRVSLHTGAIYGGTAWLCNRRGGGRGEEGRGWERRGGERGRRKKREREGKREERGAELQYRSIISHYGL